MNPFNPTRPCVVGSEWFPATSFPFAIVSDVGDAGTMEFSLESSATETIDALWFWADNVGDGRGRLSVEIWDADTLSGGAQSENPFWPGSDVENYLAYPYLSGFQNQQSQTNAWGYVDNSTLVPGTFGQNYGQTVATEDSDWVTGVFGAGYAIAFGFNGVGSDSFAGRQLLTLTIFAKVDVINTHPDHPASATFIPYLRMGPNVFQAKPTTATKYPGGYLVAYSWWFNPQTGGPWTVDVLNKFDSTYGAGAYGAGWMAQGSGSDFVQPALCNVWLDVRATVSEPRLAYGVWSTPHNGWNRVALSQLDGTPGWSKADATSYVVAVRRLDPTGSPIRTTIPATAPADNPGAVHGLEVTYSNVSRALLRIDRDNGSAPPVLLERDDAAVSQDGQPYEALSIDEKTNLDEVERWSWVYTGHTAQQDFTPGSSDDFGHVRLLLAIQNEFGAQPTAPLVITLKRRSDNVVMAGPHSVDVTDLRQPYQNWQLIDFQFDTPGSLVGGTQYYLEFTNADVSARGWKVQALSMFRPTGPGHGPATIGNAGVGGSIDTGHYDGFTHIDYAVSIGTIPNTPVGLAVANISADVDQAIRLTWTATDVEAEGACAVFARYEIERSDDGQPYQRIGAITDESVTQLEDGEIQLGVETSYRMRVIRTDGSYSLWTSSVVITINSDRCGYFLSSNEARELSQWYDDLRPRNYTVTDTTKLLSFFDRDGAVAFRGLEDPLDAFQTTLVIGAEGGHNGTVAVPVVGRKAFDPLLILIGAMKDRTTGTKVTTSYVCVRDSDGNRWFANIQVTGDAQRQEPGGGYTIKVTVRECTRTPSSIDAT